MQASNSSSPPVTFPCCSYIPRTAISWHQIMEISHTKHSLQHFWGCDNKVACKGPVAFSSQNRSVQVQSDVLLLNITQPNPDIGTLYAMVLVTQSVVAFLVRPIPLSTYPLQHERHVSLVLGPNVTWNLDASTVIDHIELMCGLHWAHVRRMMCWKGKRRILTRELIQHNAKEH